MNSLGVKHSPIVGRPRTGSDSMRPEVRASIISPSGSFYDEGGFACGGGYDDFDMSMMGPPSGRDRTLTTELGLPERLGDMGYEPLSTPRGSRRERRASASDASGSDNSGRHSGRADEAQPLRRQSACPTMSTSQVRRGIGYFTIALLTARSLHTWCRLVVCRGIGYFTSAGEVSARQLHRFEQHP